MAASRARLARRRAKRSRDLVQRDIASRYALRDTRHLMNLVLHLLAHTGQPLSLQSLAKGLAIPSVAQAARYVEYLQDA